MWYKQDTASEYWVRRGGKKDSLCCAPHAMCAGKRVSLLQSLRALFGEVSHLTPGFLRYLESQKINQLSCSPAHVHPKLPRMQQALLIKLILVQHGHTALLPAADTIFPMHMVGREASPACCLCR